MDATLRVVKVTQCTELQFGTPPASQAPPSPPPPHNPPSPPPPKSSLLMSSIIGNSNLFRPWLHLVLLPLLTGSTTSDFYVLHVRGVNHGGSVELESHMRAKERNKNNSE